MASAWQRLPWSVSSTLKLRAEMWTKLSSDVADSSQEWPESACYSLTLLAVAVSGHEWLAEEYASGRINEKQFLEALMIEVAAPIEKTGPVGMTNCSRGKGNLS